MPVLQVFGNPLQNDRLCGGETKALKIPGGHSSWPVTSALLADIGFWSDGFQWLAGNEALEKPMKSGSLPLLISKQTYGLASLKL